MTEKNLLMVCYYLGYVIFGRIATYSWKQWAFRRVGIFWEYGLNKGMRRYYPRVWTFVGRYNIVYQAAMQAFWPILYPVQFIIMTDAFKRYARLKDHLQK